MVGPEKQATVLVRRVSALKVDGLDTTLRGGVKTKTERRRDAPPPPSEGSRPSSNTFIFSHNPYCIHKRIF